jgi:hypothetical protein
MKRVDLSQIGLDYYTSTPWIALAQINKKKSPSSGIRRNRPETQVALSATTRDAATPAYDLEKYLSNYPKRTQGLARPRYRPARS